MSNIIKLQYISTINTNKKELWNSICTFQQLNDELLPVLKMTSPPKYNCIRFENFPIKSYVFVSAILLFRVIPIDRYYVRLMRVIPDSGFVEISKSIFTKKWIHIRKLEESSNCCTIIDKLEVVPRCIVFKPLIWLLIKSVFFTRHENLKSRFAIYP